MTDKLVSQNMVECTEVGKEKIKVSHLQFTDDTLFLYQRKSKQHKDFVLQCEDFF